MVIITDIDYDGKGFPLGYHMFDTETRDDNMVVHPEKEGERMTRSEYLLWLNANKDKHAQTGWSVVSKLPGTGGKMTRWDVLVSEANLDKADAEVKSLNLKA